MRILSQIAPLRALRQTWRAANARVAFVPTMGNLHAGHLALVQQAKHLADQVIVSIFVNPLQFGPKEDFNTYPRTQDADLEKLQDCNVDAVFIPTATEIYPHGLNTTCRVQASGIADDLCGKSRPGHFSGVTTVVAKLFNLVQPDIVILGQKDFQQITIIRQMVNDLNFPIEIIMAPTVREADGLALSSRNQYLTAEERKIAPKLYETLCWVQTQIRSGNEDYATLTNEATIQLSQQGFVVDYVEIRDRDNLALPTLLDNNLVVLAAAKLGKTRLIDNV